MNITQLKWCNKVSIIFILACLSTVYVWFTQSVDTMIAFEYYTSDMESSDNFLINTEGCIIPKLEPFDSTVKDFIFKETPVKCNNGTPALMSSNLTSIFLLKTSFPSYNITDQQSLKCCYNTFWRITPESNSGDNNVRFSDNCVLFRNDVNINDEYIRVKCFYDLMLIYIDYFAFIPLKKGSNKTPLQGNSLSVLVIGLDSISRLNFIRQMPKTVQVLKDLQALEFVGYNKVGDNTFPNLIPVLTGLKEEELSQTCWRKTKDHFDNCTFIWKTFKEANFRTVFAEDASWMGLFNYQRNGFSKQPTDHYWGYFNYNSLESIGNTHRMNVDQCMGATEDYVKLLEYTERFVETMNIEQENYFGFFWQSSLSHDFLNKPNLGDDNYSNLLLKLKEKGYLNNTALVFMSDHGIRWGDIRSTFQGSMEERLPLLYVYLPHWFKTDFPTAYWNLVQNTRRLTTPFDLHDTLEDLSNIKQSKKHLSSVRFKRSSNRSQSLFNVIPKNRTCDSAEIPAHFCTCQRSVEVNQTTQVVKEIVNFSVNSINKKLGNYSECVVLELVEILNARVQVASDKLSKKRLFSDYIVTFKTTPGEGIFEATVRKKEMKNKTEYEVLGSISRLNLYGSQSFCIEDFHLKLFCYCRQLILSS